MTDSFKMEVKVIVTTPRVVFEKEVKSLVRKASPVCRIHKAIACGKMRHFDKNPPTALQDPVQIPEDGNVIAMLQNIFAVDVVKLFISKGQREVFDVMHHIHSRK